MGEFRITITSSGVNAQTGEAPKKVNTANATESSGSGTSGLVKQMIVSTGKQVASYVLGNVGKYTGNSHLQTQINNGLSATALIGSFVADWKVALVNTALNIGKTVADETARVQMEQVSLSRSLARAGYSSTSEVAVSRRH